MATEDIISAFGQIQVLAADVVMWYAEALKELRKRGIMNNLFQHAILRFWKSLLDESLSPIAAIHLGNSALIKAVLPLQREEQEEVAMGRPVPVATVTDTGEIRSDDLPITRMDSPTLKRAFGPEGIRPVHEQAEMIRAEGVVKKVGGFTVYANEGAIRCNRKFSLDELPAVAAQLGYRLTVEFVGGGIRAKVNDMAAE